MAQQHVTPVKRRVWQSTCQKCICSMLIIKAVRVVRKIGGGGGMVEWGFLEA